MRDELEAAAADLAAAPFDRARWDAALDGLAQAAGGWAAQLSAVTPDRGYLLNLTSGFPDEGLDELKLERWGLDPSEMPRAKVVDAPLMQVYGDCDLISPEARARHGFYAFMDAWDASYACLARVEELDGVSFVVNATRRRRAGDAEGVDRARFAALLPHVRTAARLQMRLEDQGARIALSMMEAVGQAALVCDSLGRIVAATPAAEAALQASAFVTLRQGRLACPDPASDVALAACVARAGAPATLKHLAAGRVRLYDRARRAWIAAEVAPIPPELAAFRVQAAVMVLLQLDPPAEAEASRLMRLYGLTDAEAEVALTIARGDTAIAIADRRGVRISTVRSQLAAILAKTGTARQTELIALILRTLR